MLVLPWKQGVHGNKLMMNYSRLCTKYEVRSEDLHTAKFKMYVSVAMVTTWKHANKLYNLLPLPKAHVHQISSLNPVNAKVRKVKFLKNRNSKELCQGVCQVLSPTIQVELTL